MRWYEWKLWRFAWARGSASNRVWDADGMWTPLVIGLGLFVLIDRGTTARCLR